MEACLTFLTWINKSWGDQHNIKQKNMIVSVNYTNWWKHYIPAQYHYILSRLCRVHPCRANTGRNHQSGEDSAHLHRWPPPLKPICSSERPAWCHFQTSPGSESSQPGRPGRSSAVHSEWWEPGWTSQEEKKVDMITNKTNGSVFYKSLPLIWLVTCIVWHAWLPLLVRMAETACSILPVSPQATTRLKRQAQDRAVMACPVGSLGPVLRTVVSNSSWKRDSERAHNTSQNNVINKTFGTKVDLFFPKIPSSWSREKKLCLKSW